MGAPSAAVVEQPAEFSSADEQVRILKAAVAEKPNGHAVDLDEGFSLQPWELALLYREARHGKHVRGAARTLLRARAAEWAVMRLLRSSPSLDQTKAEKVALLLDSALVDIGTITELPGCESIDALEDIARRLMRLYDELPTTALRLTGLRRRLEIARAWRLDEVSDAEFELEQLEPEIHDPTAWTAIEDRAADSPPPATARPRPVPEPPPPSPEPPESEAEANPGRELVAAGDVDPGTRAAETTSPRAIDPATDEDRWWDDRPPGRKEPASSGATTTPNPASGAEAPESSPQPAAKRPGPPKALLAVAGTAAVVVIALVAVFVF